MGPCNSVRAGFIPLWIYIALKRAKFYCPCIIVLYLYEFTLLSNGAVKYNTDYCVLYLYEFTLLSNASPNVSTASAVLYLYEFTLLSNDNICGLCDVVFYTSMNLHCSQTILHLCRRVSRFYTSMNLHCSQTGTLARSIFLSFYTSMNLHCSQTR